LLRLSFKTSKRREEIVNEAESFFNERGFVTKEKGDCCVHMEGGGGYVRVDVVDNGEREVTLETREWEYQVKQFAAQKRR